MRVLHFGKRLQRAGKMAGAIVAVLLLITQVSAKPVFAALTTPKSNSTLSTADQDAIYQWPLWDPGLCGSGTSTSPGTPTLSGSDNEQKVWNYLKSQGLSDAQAAGIMGNIMQESGFDPLVLQGGGNSTNPADAGSGGWGIVQWTPGAKVITIAQAVGVSLPGSSGTPDQFLAAELQIVWNEMEGKDPSEQPEILNALKQISGNTQVAAAQAALFFVNNFEHGTDPGGIREQYAEQFFQKYAGTGPGSSSTSSSSSCASTGPVSCGTTSGDPEILCEAEKYKGAYYVWGGGPHGQGEYTAFSQGCPESQIATLSSKSSAANPGPCGTDCSGLVSAALDGAFKQNLGWVVSTGGIMSGADAQDWQRTPVSKAQPGDIVTLADATGHVEIVDQVMGGNIKTFGTRQTGTPASFITSPDSQWVSAWHWTGPGSTGG